MALVSEISRTKEETSVTNDELEDLSLEVSPNPWFNSVPRKKKDVIEYIEFNRDPMIDIVALIRTGCDINDIYEVISYDNSRTYVASVDYEVNSDDQTLAERISRHFKNKFMMLRLSGTPLTSFQEAADAVLSKPLVLKKTNVGLLVKLYDFYIEDKLTDTIVKDAKSADYFDDVAAFNETLTFAGSVDHATKGRKSKLFYWKAKSGVLLVVEVDHRSDISSAAPLWDYLAKKGTVGIRGLARSSYLRGRDFRVLRLAGNNFEILD